MHFITFTSAFMAASVYLVSINLNSSISKNVHDDCMDWVDWCHLTTCVQVNHMVRMWDIVYCCGDPVVSAHSSAFQWLYTHVTAHGVCVTQLTELSIMLLLSDKSTWFAEKLQRVASMSLYHQNQGVWLNVKWCFHHEVTRMSCDFEVERDEMAVLRQNDRVVIVEAVYGSDQDWNDRLSEFSNFSRWDNAAHDSQPELVMSANIFRTKVWLHFYHYIFSGDWLSNLSHTQKLGSTNAHWMVSFSTGYSVHPITTQAFTTIL